MGCCSVRSADAEVPFPAGVDLSKNSAGAGDLFVLLSILEDSLVHTTPVRQASGAS